MSNTVLGSKGRVKGFRRCTVPPPAGTAGQTGKSDKKATLLQIYNECNEIPF